MIQNFKRNDKSGLRVYREVEKNWQEQCKEGVENLTSNLFTFGKISHRNLTNEREG